MTGILETSLLFSKFLADVLLQEPSLQRFDAGRMSSRSKSQRFIWRVLIISSLLVSGDVNEMVQNIS
jgi:hypothetical protein